MAIIEPKERVYGMFTRAECRAAIKVFHPRVSRLLVVQHVLFARSRLRQGSSVHVATRPRMQMGCINPGEAECSAIIITLDYCFPGRQRSLKFPAQSKVNCRQTIYVTRQLSSSASPIFTARSPYQIFTPTEFPLSKLGVGNTIDLQKHGTVPTYSSLFNSGASL